MKNIREDLITKREITKKRMILSFRTVMKKMDKKVHLLISLSKMLRKSMNVY